MDKEERREVDALKQKVAEISVRHINARNFFIRKSKKVLRI